MLLSCVCEASRLKMLFRPQEFNNPFRIILYGRPQQLVFSYSPFVYQNSKCVGELDYTPKAICALWSVVIANVYHYVLRVCSTDVPLEEQNSRFGAFFLLLTFVWLQ